MNPVYKTLLFENLVFNSGPNVSVRRGTKWDLGRDLVHIAHTQSPANVVESVWMKTRVFRFCDLVDADLVNEHDPNCRTVAGLGAVMQNIYPDFDRRELVTLIYFDITR